MDTTDKGKSSKLSAQTVRVNQADADRVDSVECDIIGFDYGEEGTLGNRKFEDLTIMEILEIKNLADEIYGVGVFKKNSGGRRCDGGCFVLAKKQKYYRYRREDKKDYEEISFRDVLAGGEIEGNKTAEKQMMERKLKPLAVPMREG